MNLTKNHNQPNKTQIISVQKIQNPSDVEWRRTQVHESSQGIIAAAANPRRGAPNSPGTSEEPPPSDQREGVHKPLSFSECQ